MPLNKAFEAVMKRKNLNRSEFASVLGVNNQIIESVIAGKRNLSPAAMKRAYELGVPAKVLLDSITPDGRYKSRAPQATKSRENWLRHLAENKVADPKQWGRVPCDCMRLGWTVEVWSKLEYRIVGYRLTKAGRKQVKLLDLGFD